MEERPPPTPEQRKKAVRLLAATAAILAAAFALTALLSYSKGRWKGASWFLNGEQRLTTRALLLSMVSGAIFGFVDNAGLFFGLDALDPFLPGGELTRAGWGNTFSDGIGAFLGAFAAKAIQLTTGFEGGPVYGDAVGIVAGCVLGIYIPRAITGRN